MLVAGLQLGLERLVAFEAGHGHVEDWLQPRRMDAFDDVSADPGLDRLAHHARIVLVGKHDNWPWPVATDQDHLLHHIPAR
ncbi:hypothetical protein D3C80_1413630 [compost metagenome]